ncbi:MAG: hypothetical protein QME40_04990 [bacterium]|nr:hypothetical protein [bacterium]
MGKGILKRIGAEIRHAFTIEEPQFTSEEIALLEKVATEINKRKMTHSAILFLESVRPLNFIGSQLMIALKPILDLFVNPTEYEKVAKILEKRKAIDRLIELIEGYIK